MDKVVHFEVPADDSKRAQEFYATVFDWQINEMPMQGGGTYIGARSVEVDEETFIPKEPGAINGGIVERSKDVPAPIITMSVASIEDTFKKIEAAGGKMVKEKTEIPEMGYYAYATDSEGNAIGLWEDLKKNG